MVAFGMLFVQALRPSANAQVSDHGVTSLEELVEPVRRAAGRIGNKGGAPTLVAKRDKLQALFVAAKSKRSVTTSAEAYEDAAEEWNKAHPKRKKHTGHTFKKELTELRKRRPK